MSDETMEARGVFAAVCGVAGAAGSTTGTELTPAAEIRAYVDKVWPSFLDDLEALVVVPSVVDESRAVAGARGAWNVIGRFALRWMWRAARGFRSLTATGTSRMASLPVRRPNRWQRLPMWTWFQRVRAGRSNPML